MGSMTAQGAALPRCQPGSGSPYLGQHFSSTLVNIELIAAQSQETYVHTDQDILTMTFQPVSARAAANIDKISTVNVLPNTLHFVPAGSTRCGHLTHRGSLFLGARISPKIKHQLCAELGVAPETIDAMANISTPLIQHVSLALFHFMRSQNFEGGAMIANALLTTAMAEVVRVATGRAGAPLSIKSNSRSRPMVRVIDYIEANLSKDLRLEELAGVAAMSVFHFARTFAAAQGVPPQTYVRMRRIELAKTLLHQGDMPLAEVALQCGFSSQSHFTRVFHKYAGTTPGIFRRNIHAA